MSESSGTKNRLSSAGARPLAVLDLVNWIANFLSVNNKVENDYYYNYIWGCAFWYVTINQVSSTLKDFISPRRWFWFRS
jgi:hypothetical protein